jgi:hypothetical protein
MKQSSFDSERRNGASFLGGKTAAENALFDIQDCGRVNRHKASHS